jgi:hypothetical protein
MKQNLLSIYYRSWESLDRNREDAFSRDHLVHFDRPFAGFRLVEQARAAKILALIEDVDGGRRRVGHFFIFD